MGFYIPPEVVVNILSRLPTESLRQCKLVCKTWLDLIVYDPSFTRMHIQHRHRQKLSNDHDSSGETSFIFGIPDNIGFKQFYYARFNSKYENLMKVSDMDITHSFDSDLYSSSSSTSYRIIGSCDGLICIAAFYVLFCDYFETYQLYICNPMTRECSVLPPLDNEQYEHSHFGFGFIPCTNEYKVIGFIGNENGYQAYVYTLGSGNGWRNIGFINKTIYRSLNSRADSWCTVFLDGALIWVDHHGSILSFDLADEKLQLLPPAPCFEPFLDDWGPKCSYELRVMEDCLCIVLQHHDVLYDFWLLNKEEEKDESEYNANCDKKEQKQQSRSWRCWEFKLRWKHRWDIAKPFALTMDGKILFHNEKAFYLHDLEDEASYYPLVDFDKRGGNASLESYGDYVKRRWIREPILHVNSFVSLKALGEKDTITMKSNEACELESIVPELNYRRGENSEKMEICLETTWMYEFLS